MKTILLVAVTCLLLGTANAVTHYTWNFNNVPSAAGDVSIGTQRAYYDLGYIYQDNTIEVNLTIPGTSTFDLTNLAVLVRDKANAQAALTQAPAGGCTAGAVTCTLTFAVTVSDNYVVIITDTDRPVDNAGAIAAPTALKLFYLDISYWLTSSTGPSNSSAIIYPLRKST